MYKANKIKTFTPVLPEGTGPTGTNAQECIAEIVNDLNGNLLGKLNDDQLELIERFLTDGLEVNYLIDGEYTVFEEYKIRIKHMSINEFESFPEFEGY